MYAVSLDLDELDERRWYISVQPNQKKYPWKWRSPDHAGTLPLQEDVTFGEFGEWFKEYQSKEHRGERVPIQRVGLDQIIKTTNKEILILKDRKLYKDGELFADISSMNHEQIAKLTSKYMVLRENATKH